MVKIRELINFNDLNDDIDIQSINDLEKAKTIVSSCIIPENLKSAIIGVIRDLSHHTHRAVQIIGGYGSGKTHIISWFMALLENNELVNMIPDEEIRAEVRQNLLRNYVLIKCKPKQMDVTLKNHFYTVLKEQLSKDYKIELPELNVSDQIDDSLMIGDILDIIKQNDHNTGLIVFIDDLSDYFDGKTRTLVNNDIRFLDTLSNISQGCDFNFFFAARVPILSDFNFVDNPESYGSVSERYNLINISDMDISRVISEKVLNKDLIKRTEIDYFLTEYKKEYPGINENIAQYIDLFPVVPLAVKLMNEMPYFQNKGALVLAHEKVMTMLDFEFPTFLTCDSLYDDILSDPKNRSLDEVTPVIIAVEFLENKIKAFDEEFREIAKKMLKILGILKIYGNTCHNGMTIDDLANEMMIIPKKHSMSKIITEILNKIRKITGGQYISVSSDGIVSLNLSQGRDHDEVINNRMKNLPEGLKDQQLLGIIKHNDLIDAIFSENYIRKFLDISKWKDKRSFRIGNFIYDDGSLQVQKGNLDFNLIVLSPYKKTHFHSGKETAVLRTKYCNELDLALGHLSAIYLLLKERYANSIMEKKFKTIKHLAENVLLRVFLESEMEFDGNIQKAGDFFKKRPSNIDEFFYFLKEAVFNQHFSQKYHKYPKLHNQVTYYNIKQEVEKCINGLFSKGEKGFGHFSPNIIMALRLMDNDGFIDTDNSIYAKLVIDELQREQSRTVRLVDIISKLRRPPFGLDKELIYLLLTVMTFSGHINLITGLKNKIDSLELPSFFDSGLKIFDDIALLSLDEGFPAEALSLLFSSLKLNPALIINPRKRTKAIVELKNKVSAINIIIDHNRRKINDLYLKYKLIKEAERDNLLQELEQFPIQQFFKINSVNDFRILDFDKHKMKQIQNNIKLIYNIEAFFNDFENINDEYIYMNGSMDFIQKHDTFFSDSDIKNLQAIVKYNSGLFYESIFNDTKRDALMKGLLNYKKNFTRLYISNHDECVGNTPKRAGLKNLAQGPRLKKLRELVVLSCLNSADLQRLEHKIQFLSRTNCSALQEKHLTIDYKCPSCRFPEELPLNFSMSEELEGLQYSMNMVFETWTGIILREIINFKYKLNTLNAQDKIIVSSIDKAQKLPDIIDKSVISALSSLFSGIKEVVINPGDITDFIFSDSSVLDYPEFSARLDTFIKERINNTHKNNIRIMKGGGPL